MRLYEIFKGYTCCYQKILFLFSGFYLLCFASACATDGATVSVQEAKNIALEFQGRYKNMPPRGIDEDIKNLIKQHSEQRASFDQSEASPRPKYTYESIAELANGIASVSEYGPAPQLSFMAWSEFINGNVNNALMLSNHVERMNPNLYGGTIAYTILQKAVFFAELGDFQSARQSLQKGISMVRARGSIQRMGPYTYFTYYESLGRGMVAFSKGDMKTAEILFYKTLQIYDTVRYTDFAVGHLNNYGHQTYLLLCIARTMLELGRMPEAELWIREALKSYKGQYFLLPHCLAVLSDIFMAQNRYEDANIISQTALNFVLENISYTDALIRAKTRESLARTYLALGNWQKAVAQFDLLTMEMSTDPDTYDTWFKDSPDGGFAQLMTNHPKEALGQFDRALVKIRRNFDSDHYVILEVEVLRAMALAADNQTEMALAVFEDVLPSLIMKWKEQRAESGRVYTSRYKVERFIQAYLDLLDRTRQVSRLETALSLADILHTDSVTQALSSSAVRASVSDPELAALIRQRQDLGLQLSTVQGRVNVLLKQSGPDQYKKILDTLRAEITQLRGAVSALEAEISDRFPRYSAIVNPEAMTVQRIKHILKDDEAYIFLFPCPDKTFVWAFQARGPVAFKKIDIDRHSLAETVSQLRKAVDPENVKNAADIPEFNLELAYDLYEMILQPVASGWKSARSLLVVSSNPLGQLPLSILPTDKPSHTATTGLLFAGYRGVPWLARSHAITMLPSATTLAALRNIPEVHSNQRAFAGFGDPWFQPVSGDNTPHRGEDGVTQLASRGGQVQLRGVRVSEVGGLDVKQLTSITLEQLIRLPETAGEIRSIARAVGADEERDVFLGPDASESNVKNLDLQNRRIIVFATHGLIPGDLNGLEQPALALSAPQVTHSEEDGLLTMSEIMGLNLNADWVVLSACNTAAGEGAGAEAVSGLGQAFFYAGTKALLVSSWPVETTSAKRLTTGLFRLQVEHPDLSRAELLRKSMLALLDDSAGNSFSYAHPIFWAPFIIVGE